MHIPDGFLTPAVSAATFGLALTGVGIATWKLKGTKPDIVKIGLVGGAIFAAQMLNFPIPGGTSGHLIGGALAAAALGPSAAILVMTAILIVQAVLFHDGGLFALGANILSMGLIAPLAGWGITMAVRRMLSGKAAAAPALMLAGIGSVAAAAMATGLYLAASGTSPFGTVVPAMLSWHMWIGLAEGAATALLIRVAERRSLTSSLAEVNRHAA